MLIIFTKKSRLKVNFLENENRYDEFIPKQSIHK